MRIFGVVCFVVGVVALASLAIRRGRDTPLQWPDYVMTFVGLASALAGLALFFVYAAKV